MNDIPDSRHPNSPLVEVVFEIRFPGETAVECRRHELQETLRADFPNLLVPHAEVGTPIATQPYRFEETDGSSGVMVALNRFAYYTRRYPGYEAFRPRCLELVAIFGSLFPPRELTRVGLRHVNIIPYARDGGLIPLDDFLLLGGALGKVLDGRFENFNTAFVLPVAGGKITTRIETIVRTDGRQDALLLDFDYAKDGNLDFARVHDYLEEAHEKSAELFHSLITPTYRDHIRGEEG